MAPIPEPESERIIPYGVRCRPRAAGRTGELRELVGRSLVESRDRVFQRGNRRVAGAEPEKAKAPDLARARRGLAGSRQLDPSHPAFVNHKALTLNLAKTIVEAAVGTLPETDVVPDVRLA